MIFTHHNHRKRQVGVHSTSVYLNGVVIQTLRRGVEHDLSQAEDARSSWQPTAFPRVNLDKKQQRKKVKGAENRNIFELT